MFETFCANWNFFCKVVITVLTVLWTLSAKSKRRILIKRNSAIKTWIIRRTSETTFHARLTIIWGEKLSLWTRITLRVWIVLTRIFSLTTIFTNKNISGFAIQANRWINWTILTILFFTSNTKTILIRPIANITEYAFIKLLPTL